MTNNITLAQRLAFLQALDLPDSPELLAQGEEIPVTLFETPKPACVDAGQIVTFSPNITKMEQADVLNSCLLAQLAASKKYKREEDPVEWYRFYSDVLAHCGWLMDSFRFQEYTSSSASFGIDTFIVNLLYSLLTGSMLTTAMTAINFLRSLQNTDPRSLLFDHHSHSGKDGNFQLGACFHENKVLTMSLGCSYFSASQAADSFFFLHFESADSLIYFSNQNIKLDMDVYSVIREDVIQKLGNRAKTYIKELEI